MCGTCTFFIKCLVVWVSLFFSGKAQAPGGWRLLQENAGVSAMHIQLLRNDRVIIFDRTSFGSSNISLPEGSCRNDTGVDCTAHSIEYDVESNTIRPLTIQSDTWCSSGSVFPDGRLFQTGGYNDGERSVRVISPCTTCDWEEIPSALNVERWYATNHFLPDGLQQIIIGGIYQSNYEYYPKTSIAENIDLPFLDETYDEGILNNLYPFVFLLPNGNLFIFSNNRAISFNYRTNTVARRYPTVPGGDPRNYPSTGSAVMLPLRSINSPLPSIAVDVLVCGGAPRTSYDLAVSGTFIEALQTCARMRVTDSRPRWTMETMPFPRVMGDMILLPNGNVLIINGARSGVAGWDLGRDPVLNPVVYVPGNPSSSRFQVQAPSDIPRMYHSVACLVRDGRVLVGGSNPHFAYEFFNVLFPTELRLEAFSPGYLDSRFDSLRPTITTPRRTSILRYGDTLTIRFQVAAPLVASRVSATMVSPAFTTHSFSMNQRVLFLPTSGLRTISNSTVSTYEIRVAMPGSAVLAPPGFYMCFLNHQDIPSSGIWAQIT